MAGGFNELLDFLDQSMLDLYNEYAATAVSFWQEFQGNPGQSAIIKQYIIPAAAEHARAAKDYWPIGLGPHDYYDAILSCYEPEVIERALGESLNDVYSVLADMQGEAEGLEAEHDMMVGNGPHSTEAVWR